MRHKVIAAVLAVTLVGIVGAEGASKAQEMTLPRGTITVEDVGSTTVAPSMHQPVLAANTAY